MDNNLHQSDDEFLSSSANVRTSLLFSDNAMVDDEDMEQSEVVAHKSMGSKHVEDDQVSEDVLAVHSAFHIPHEVLVENPDFCKLLSVISQHISPETGLRKDEELELKKMEAVMEKEKQIYFQNYIILDTVKDMIEDETYIEENPQLSSTLTKLDSVLVKAQVSQSLNISDSSFNGVVNVYGIDDQILDDTVQDSENLEEEIQNLVIPELEQRLERMYEDLLQFYQPFPTEHLSLFIAQDSVQEDGLLSVPQVDDSTLTSLVRNHTKQIKKEKSSLLDQKQKLHQYIYNYFNKLNQCLEILCTLIDNYKCGSFRQYDESTISWLVQRSEAMKLKLL